MSFERGIREETPLGEAEEPGALSARQLGEIWSTDAVDNTRCPASLEERAQTAHPLSNVICDLGRALGWELYADLNFVFHFM